MYEIKKEGIFLGDEMQKKQEKNNNIKEVFNTRKLIHFFLSVYFGSGVEEKWQKNRGVKLLIFLYLIQLPQ